MKKSELTQEKLADATGISQPTISRYLRAVTEPKVGDFCSIASALGIPMDELWPDGCESLSETAPPYRVEIDWKERALIAERQLAELKAKMKQLSGG